MTDREKVIRAIDGCINTDDYCNDCDYDGCVFHHGSCEKDLLADALALLKEQEDRIGTLNRALEQTPKPTKLLDVFGDGYAKVVRCKDCKHWWKKNELCTHEKTMDGSVCCLEAKPDFYCGYGERR